MKVQFEKPDNSEEMDFSTLTAGNVYWVIGIEGDWYRLINDDGEPLLYPPSAFLVVDKTEPPEWVTQYGEGNERYSSPLELSAPGFFEDYFDGLQTARQTLRRYLQYRRQALATADTDKTANIYPNKIAA